MNRELHKNPHFERTLEINTYPKFERQPFVKLISKDRNKHLNLVVHVDRCNDAAISLEIADVVKLRDMIDEALAGPWQATDYSHIGRFLADGTWTLWGTAATEKAAHTMVTLLNLHGPGVDVSANG